MRDVPITKSSLAVGAHYRTNRRWMTLLQLARLFLAREWEATHHDLKYNKDSVSLLFPMNELFESITAKMLRRALAPLGLDVGSQGGFRNCLGQWSEDAPCAGAFFRTKPDIIVRAGGRTVAIVDAKWKCLRKAADERNRGIAQTDIYQLMAYSQLYQCDRLMLIYPHHAGLGDEGVQEDYGIAVPNRHPATRLKLPQSTSQKASEALPNPCAPWSWAFG